MISIFSPLFEGSAIPILSGLCFSLIFKIYPSMLVSYLIYLDLSPLSYSVCCLFKLMFRRLFIRISPWELRRVVYSPTQGLFSWLYSFFFFFIFFHKLDFSCGLLRLYVSVCIYFSLYWHFKGIINCAYGQDKRCIRVHNS